MPCKKWVVEEGRRLCCAQQNEAGCATSHFGLLTGFSFISSSSDLVIHELGSATQSFLGNFQVMNKRAAVEQG